MPDISAGPNVVLVIIDDLAYGDLVCHGNPYTQTPHLDQLYAQSSRFTQTCSGPVCTPARAMLMTGRYAYRTKAIDTYCGRTTMDPNEVTLAQVLRDRGYATCLSGKWHLGDNAPSRPQDLGFDEVLMHNGGGLRQPGNYGYWQRWDSYQDPYLMHNGTGARHKGYCTDIFTDHAIDFIQKHQNEPFFAYLGANAPHTPLEVPDSWLERYAQVDLPETFKRVYAMVDNLDYNIGRLRKALDEMGLADNTVLIFTSDHGPCASASHEGSIRFNAGLRDRKGTMYDGGVRVPLFWHWPKRIKPDRVIDRVASPIDVMPTLASICGAAVPDDRLIDGVDLSPLLLEPDAAANWPDRTIFLQGHRGDVPQLYNNCLARDQRFKLVNGCELYDMQADPNETTNVAEAHPEVVARLRAAYEAWFAQVCAERPDNFAPLPIALGSADENPLVLNRNDRRTHGKDGWNEDPTHGHWEIKPTSTDPQSFDIDIEFRPMQQPGTAFLAIGDQCWSQLVAVGAQGCRFAQRRVEAGQQRVQSWVSDGQELLGARYVIFRWGQSRV